MDALPGRRRPIDPPEPHWAGTEWVLAGLVLTLLVLRWLAGAGP
jgi:hypothetical protein